MKRKLIYQITIEGESCGTFLGAGTSEHEAEWLKRSAASFADVAERFYGITLQGRTVQVVRVHEGQP